MVDCSAVANQNGQDVSTFVQWNFSQQTKQLHTQLDGGKSKNLGGKHDQNKRKIIKHLMNLPFGEEWEKGNISTGPGCS